MTSVAIITRTKDRPVMLRRALKSIAGQSFTDFDWVIVNDGGDSQLVEDIIAAASISDLNIIIEHNQYSMGMEAASNIGLRISKSKYVVIHDDDDTWEQDFLLRTVDFLEKNKQNGAVKGVVTRSMQVEEVIEKDEVVITRTKPYNPDLVAVNLFQIASLQFIPPPISFLYSRETLDKIGHYREDLPVLGDWEFYLRFLRHYEIGVIPEYLANYHLRIELLHGVYSNTVIANTDTHKICASRLRDELLREDLNKGVVGMGLIVNTANEFVRLRSEMQKESLMIRNELTKINTSLSRINEIIDKFSNSRFMKVLFKIFTVK